MNLRLFAGSCLMALGAAAMIACSNDAAEEENATVVNVEKGVAPAMATPEAGGGMAADEPMPAVAPVKAEPETEAAPAEAEADGGDGTDLKADKAPTEGRKADKATKADKKGE